MRGDQSYEHAHILRLGARRPLSEARRFTRQTFARRTHPAPTSRDGLFDAGPRIGQRVPSLDSDTVEESDLICSPMDESIVDAAIAELALHFERIEQLDAGAPGRPTHRRAGATWRGPATRANIPTLEAIPAIIIPIAG